jgi:hypothetical protein
MTIDYRSPRKTRLGLAIFAYSALVGPYLCLIGFREFCYRSPYWLVSKLGRWPPGPPDYWTNDVSRLRHYLFEWYSWTVFAFTGLLLLLSLALITRSFRDKFGSRVRYWPLVLIADWICIFFLFTRKDFL